MGPATLRRYRAERLLRQEFEGLRGRVLGAVRARLRASGAALDDADLEACYGQAWQGLYASVLEGRQIANPTGWLVLVTFRRAIEEQRASRRVRCTGSQRGAGGAEAGPVPRGVLERAEQRDLAEELDDRVRLRQLFEGLRRHLTPRELQAATLCYLQGLPRAEAAVHMGVSEARMRKLMEGRGAGRPGVAGKVGALLATIREGGACEEQGSLMRGLAFGILDPEGDRYRLAVMHREQCPACRAYVVSLRGLAALLPPTLSPWGLAGGAVAGNGAQAGGGLGGALSASGAAAGSAAAGGGAGGGWLLAGGPLGAKLAAGCLLALGVGAGCVALNVAPGHLHTPMPERRALHRADTRGGAFAERQAASATAMATPAASASLAIRSRAASTPTPPPGAGREFGLERGGSPGGSSSPAPSASNATLAHAAGYRPATSPEASSEGTGSSGTSVLTPAPRPAGAAPAAQREFAPG